MSVRQQFVRNEITTPKSKAGRRRLPLGPVAAEALEEQYRASRHRTDDSIVFCHLALGTPLDPSKLSTSARKALTKANVPQSFRRWHGLRHTALTETAAAGVPGMFVQARPVTRTARRLSGISTRTGRAYPDSAELAERRVFQCFPKAESSGGG